MKVGFIGAGKVGFSLGRLFCEKNIHVTGYYNRHVEGAKEAAEFTKTKYFTDIKSLLQESDLIFLTVSDGAITSVYEQLLGDDLSGKIICHTSGALNASEAFPDIKKYNAYGFSVHPLFPVSDKYLSYERLSDAFFCIEGDNEHIADVSNLLEKAGLKVRLISSEGKVKYHLACAVASNLYCALMQESISLLSDCGFDESSALEALKPLVYANIDSIMKNGVTNSLTGPVERADIGTVKKHIDCIAEDDERDMYISASKQLLKIAVNKHPERDYRQLESELYKKNR